MRYSTVRNGAAVALDAVTPVRILAGTETRIGARITNRSAVVMYVAAVRAGAAAPTKTNMVDESKADYAMAAGTTIIDYAGPGVDYYAVLASSTGSAYVNELI